MVAPVSRNVRQVPHLEKIFAVSGKMNVTSLVLY
jgi:hypothetical protein